MQRGMPRSGRGNHGSQPMNSGPLMTEHLHNLDLELELLKRKREMLEQQQQHIEDQRSSRQRPYNLDQPRYFEQERSSTLESSSNRNYSELYDPADIHDFIPLASDRKRRSDYQWTNDLPAKRFSGPKSGNVAQSFGSRLGPLLQAPRTEYQQSSGSFQRGRFESDTNRDLLAKNEPQALMALNMRRPPLNMRHVQKQNRKDFKPTKVTKSKSKKPPTEGSERKEPAAPAAPAAKKVNEAMVLRANREPSPQLTGRLELALGQILKDLKLKYGERSSHAHIFQQQNLLRLMKQMIRERVRSAMLGKFVGPCKDVLDAYRSAYPLATDDDIVEAALRAETNTAPKKFDIKLVETDNPEKYFKANTEKLIDLKLREMFNKLIEIYTSPLSNTNDESNKDKELKKEKDVDFTTDLTEEEIKKADEKESDIKLEDYKISIDKLEEMIKWRLPRVLKKFIPFIIKVFNIDQMYEATRASLIMKTNDKAMAIAKKLDKVDLGPTRTWAPAPVNKDQDGTSDGQTSSSGIQNYYVKIFGRPLLPKRKLMQQFLDQFCPKSVKKHKALHNLLYVVFVNKDNFDKILAEDGVVIGKSTIEIKVSEQRPNQKKTTQDSNDDEVQIIEDVNKTINLDDTLNSINDELDEQITDLLTSIRQAEEEQAKETEENDKTVMEGIDDLVGNENDSIPESKTEDESQNKSNDVPKDVEIPDEVNNTISEGLNEPNETQDVAKADELKEIKEGTETDEKGPEMESNDHKELKDSAEKTNDNVVEEFEKEDVVATLKSDKDSGRATPTRTSARLANITPSTIKTRRASRLEQ